MKNFAKIIVAVFALLFVALLVVAAFVPSETVCEVAAIASIFCVTVSAITYAVKG